MLRQLPEMNVREWNAAFASIGTVTLTWSDITCLNILRPLSSLHSNSTTKTYTLWSLKHATHMQTQPKGSPTVGLCILRLEFNIGLYQSMSALTSGQSCSQRCCKWLNKYISKLESDQNSLPRWQACVCLC